MQSFSSLPSLADDAPTSENPDDLVALFYESALRPESWPDALEALRRQMQASVAILTLISPERTEVTLINRGMEAAVAAYDRAGPDPGARRAARLAADHAGFLRDSDYMDGRQLQDDPSRRFLAREFGLGPSISGLLHFDSGGIAVLALERAIGMPDFSDDEIAWLDRLRPHMLRACIVSAEARRVAAEDRVRILDLIGYAAATLNIDGKLIASNSRLKRLFPTGPRTERRFTLFDPAADARLAKALEGRAAQSIAQPARAGFPALVVHLLPLAAPDRGMFNGAAWLAVALEPGSGANRAAQAGPDLLEALYGLTPAEARVAARIALGERVDDVAAANRVTRETVRSQVRAILSKTGLARQTDLAPLLAGILLRG